MPAPKVAIVGASGRAAAQSALRAGFSAVSADLFADADLAAVCPASRIADYPAGLVDWLAGIECDGWLYTGALENRPELVDEMAALKPLWGNAGQSLRACRNPLRLQAVCGLREIPFPETRPEAASVPRDGAWLAKSYQGSSGSGVWRLDGEAAVRRAERERAVAQRFVAGAPAAAIFMLGAKSAELWGVSRQLVGGDSERPWRYAGSIGPLPRSKKIQRGLNQLGRMLREDFGLRGIVGADLVVAADGFHLLEVNPRYTASVEVLERAHGRSAIAAHLVACGAEVEGSEDGSGHADASADAMTEPVHGKAIIYAPADGRVLPSFAEFALEAALHDPRRPLADIPRAGEFIRRGDPLLTAFAAGRTIDECASRLDAFVAEILRRPFGYNDGPRPVS
ncbi:MAG: ATP-grasp domain-containing protein [Pirellulales bacterium]|nr:ATP-grasp domain-containing protein [Pirellulales bacterium]